MYSEQSQARNAHVTINAVHPGNVKTGITRDRNGFVSGMNYFTCMLPSSFFLLLLIVPKMTGNTKYILNLPQLL